MLQVLIILTKRVSVASVSLIYRSCNFQSRIRLHGGLISRNFMQDSMFNYSFQESIVICSFMEIDIVNIDRDARRCLASLRYFCIAIFKAQLDI